MNRIDFIKGIISTGFLGWVISDKKNQLHNTTEKKVIYESYVRGYVHSPLFDQLSSLHSNGILQIVREPNNAHDPFAIALYFKNQKLGYVPAEDNYIISQMMDVNHGRFTAEIVNIDKNAPTWEQVAFRIMSHQ